MKRGLRPYGGFAALFLLSAGGCAVNPLASLSDSRPDIVVERDILADAAEAVETAPWPQVHDVSFVSRITGADEGERMTRSMAIDLYLEELQPDGARFTQLASDARANLAAADRLLAAADGALAASRLTMTDVITIETAIQALREHRQIYTSAAKQIEKTGEPVDEAQLDAIREAYADAIRALGRSADALADRIETDRTETYAAPAPVHRKNFSGV